MANNSRYYKEKYNDAKKKERQLNGDINDLKSIIGKLDDLPDEIRRVNTELNQLDEDLRASVRHNRGFDSARRDAVDNKERSARSDGHLSVVYSEVEEEIRRLERKKDQVAKDKDRYKDQYDRKKKEEIEQLWDSIF